MIAGAAWLLTPLAVLALGYGPLGGTASAQSPSLSCATVPAGSVDEMVCTDSELSSLDRTLADVFTAASRKATDEQRPVLKAEQRLWTKARDECGKSDDRRGCVLGEYKRRIAALQARYGLMPGIGPFAFICEADPRHELVVTFFRTDPETLVADYGGRLSVMYRQRAASGTRYEGPDETFWEHQGEARVRWGHGAPEMLCKRGP